MALEAAVNGVDMGTLDATLTALEGSDEELARFQHFSRREASERRFPNLMGTRTTAEEATVLPFLLHRPPRFHHHQTPEGQKSLG